MGTTTECRMMKLQISADRVEVCSIDRNHVNSRMLSVIIAGREVMLVPCKALLLPIPPPGARSSTRTSVHGELCCLVSDRHQYPTS